MEHQVRVADLIVAAQEAAALEVVGRPWPAAQEEPPGADGRPVTPFQRRRDRDRELGPELHVDLQVILQVLADAGQVGDHVDAGRGQVVRGTDPGQLQQLRRVDRAAGQDDLPRPGPAGSPGAAGEFHAAGPFRIEKNFRHERPGADVEVRAVQHRVQVRLGLAFVTPVVEPVADRDGQRGRHVDEHVPAVIRAAGLQHQHLVGGVGGEPAGQRAARGAAPDDDEVVLLAQPARLPGAAFRSHFGMLYRRRRRPETGHQAARLQRAGRGADGDDPAFHPGAGLVLRWHRPQAGPRACSRARPRACSRACSRACRSVAREFSWAVDPGLARSCGV